MSPSIHISLTDFVDFTATAGSPRLTKVRRIKTRGEYHPSHDFWKLLREEIVDVHRRGAPKTELDDMVARITDAKKLARYPECVRAYKRFLGRKTVSWFDPPTAEWRPHSLRIRVNPER
jgi:hypothetical protein